MYSCFLELKSIFILNFDSNKNTVFTVAAFEIVAHTFCPDLLLCISFCFDLFLVSFFLTSNLFQ